MAKHALSFVQSNTPNGTCKCYYNGKLIDTCDMNYAEKYTQAHVVLASLQKAIGSKEQIMILFDGYSILGHYPETTIRNMANDLIVKKKKLKSYRIN